MNKGANLHWDLERKLADRLKELLKKISWLENWSVRSFPGRDRGFDFLVQLPTPKGGKAELWVECKSDPRPSLFPYVYVASEAARPPVLVLAAPFISPRMAQVCKENSWSWFDLAGNCQLDIPPVLYIERHGHAPIHRRPRPTANLSTPQAGRVIRALLAPENAGFRWTQREMEKHFGEINTPVSKPSLGLVNKVIRYLQDEAFLELLPDGGFRLRDPLGLLKVWRHAYRFDRHRRRGYFTLLKGPRLQEALAKLESLTGGHAVYAAFSAAEFQAPHVRQPKTWLFVGEKYEDKFCTVAEAKLVESGENVVVLIPEDDGVFYEQVGGFMGERRLSCTNPVQTYVDLCNVGSRGEEAAEALLEQNLKPEWKHRGLL